MSERVNVADGDSQAETASALLAAARDLGLDASVVQLDTAAGGFTVPAEVAKKAKGVKTFDPDEEMVLAVSDATENAQVKTKTVQHPVFGEQEVVDTNATPDHDAAAHAVGHIDPGPDPQEVADEAQKPSQEAPSKPAKKAAAKKTTTRKRAAKKTTANKAAAKKGS